MKVEDLTLSTVKSYADACRHLHIYMQALRLDGHDLLVVPSRGAHPFLHGAHCYAYELRNEADSDLFVPRLNWLDELYLPFTADISRDQSISSSTIRRYWSRVLAALLKRDDNDSAYRFYEHLRAIAGELAVGSNHIRGGKTGKFIFIDTVVSGRAISEIFEAFSAYGLNECHFLLLVDERGAKLKPRFARCIEQMKNAERATIIPVDQIFTEDEGPAMSGIWTVTMPDVMQAAEKMIPDLADGDKFAATLFYHEVSRRKDDSNLRITVSNSMLSTLLFAAIKDDDAVTERFLKRFRDHVSGGALQRQDVTKVIADPLIMRNIPIITSTDVSSSHVIRAFTNEREAEKLIKGFLERRLTRFA